MSGGAAVCGASGFIGSRLAATLEQCGVAVAGFGRGTHIVQEGGSPRSRRDYVHVDDVVDAMARVHFAAAGSLPPILDIGSGRPTSLVELLTLVVEAAAVLLREQGADVTLVVRAPRLVWNDLPGALGESRYRRIRYPETGLGRGWRNKVWADAPGLFRRLPDAKRAHLVRTTLGPAGSWWLREPFARAFDERSVRTGTEVVAAKQDRGRVLLDLRGPRGMYGMEVDHVVAATGYEVDVRRLTVLDEPLRGAVRGPRDTSGPPMLGPSFDSSVPGLHVVGLAAAATFGPAMRFVFGSRFTARRVARALPH